MVFIHLVVDISTGAKSAPKQVHDVTSCSAREGTAMHPTYAPFDKVSFAAFRSSYLWASVTDDDAEVSFYNEHVVTDSGRLCRRAGRP